MKYIVLIGDGMADEPIARLDGRTPMSAAAKPYIWESAAIQALLCTTLLSILMRTA